MRTTRLARGFALVASGLVLSACGARSDLTAQGGHDGDIVGSGGSAPLGGGSAGGSPPAICGDGIVAPDEACDVAIDAVLCDPSCRGRQARTLSLSSVQGLATDETGTARIWGTNFFGTFGAPPLPNVASLPIELPIADVVDVSAHTAACVLDGGGSVRCAGPNDLGQLGLPPSGGAVVAYDPMAIPPAMQVVTAGQHGCALATDGSLRCWGRNGSGEVDGTVTFGWVAPTLLPLADIVEIAATDEGSCARSRQGEVTCWGDQEPGLRVIALPVAHELSGGGAPCSRIGGGEVRCWGWRDGSYDATPHAIAGVSSLVRLGRSSLAHGCGVDAQGRGVCWGANGFGELGRGALGGVDDEAGPVTVVTSLAAIEAGDNATCARLLDGRVACWGSNQNGRLGTTEGAWVQQVFLAPVFVPGFP